MKAIAHRLALVAGLGKFANHLAMVAVYGSRTMNA